MADLLEAVKSRMVEEADMRRKLQEKRDDEAVRARTTLNRSIVVLKVLILVHALYVAGLSQYPNIVEGNQESSISNVSNNSFTGVWYLIYFGPTAIGLLVGMFFVSYRTQWLCLLHWILSFLLTAYHVVFLSVLFTYLGVTVGANMAMHVLYICELGFGTLEWLVDLVALVRWSSANDAVTSFGSGGGV